MTADDRALVYELLRLRAAATGGEWHQGPYYKADIHTPTSSFAIGDSMIPQRCRDAKFIAWCGTHAAGLVERLAKRVEELESKHGT